MASKLELLRIKGSRLIDMIDDIHYYNECPENLKPYWGIYSCELCNHLVEEMHKDVYLKMPWYLKLYVNLDYLTGNFIVYPIQDAYYWLLVKITSKRTLSTTEPKEK